MEQVANKSPRDLPESKNIVKLSTMILKNGLKPLKV
jgi:hypothetical protein